MTYHLFKKKFFFDVIVVYFSLPKGDENIYKISGLCRLQIVSIQLGIWVGEVVTHKVRNVAKASIFKQKCTGFGNNYPEINNNTKCNLHLLYVLIPTVTHNFVMPLLLLAKNYYQAWMGINWYRKGTSHDIFTCLP